MAISSVRRITSAATITVLAIALAIAPGVGQAAPKNVVVGFDWTPAAPTPGEVVTFTATADPAEDLKFEWDLNGDGGVDQRGKTATWSYAAPGPVTVRLFGKGKGNRRGEAAHVVSVRAPDGGSVPAPPTASFTIAPATPVVNQPVLFTSTSSDSDGTVTQEAWDLNGDGNYDNGGGVTALRAFGQAGEYVIGLRVTDNSGLVSFDSQALTVLPAMTPATATAVTTQKLGLRLLSPFPVVRIAGRIAKRGTRVRLLRVEAPVGTTVSVRCGGRGCPFKKQVRAVRTSVKSRASASVRVRRLERLLLPGVRVRVYVTGAGAVGKYTRLRFRAGHSPARTDRCLMPGSWAPTACSAL